MALALIYDVFGAAWKAAAPSRHRNYIFCRGECILYSDVDNTACIIRIDVAFPGLVLEYFGQGRSMSFCIKLPREASSFGIFSDSMLQNSSLPWSEAIGCEVFEEAFVYFNVNFGNDEDAVYTPVLVLWAFISQALFKEEQRSCDAAVARIAAWWVARDRVVEVRSKPIAGRVMLVDGFTVDAADTPENQQEYLQNPA